MNMNTNMNLDTHHLPPVIAAFIAAANKPDPQAYVDCFAEHAVVVDEGQEWTGKPAIKQWSDQYHFGANVTLEPRAVKSNGDEIVVTCKVDGDYDKTGLPDPLLLGFHFQLQDEKIVRLHIY